MLPSLFVSHGAPTLILENVSARDFLRSLGASIKQPKAIVVASAHWETDVPTVSTAATPETIHDFGGFPDELYRLSYPAPGAPQLALRVVELLSRRGIAATTDSTRGLDHGAWVPLLLMYPAADIPVLQISIQPHHGPQHHLDIGRALAPLCEDDVLILGSGGAVHNLRALAWNRHEAPDAWAQAFDDWLANKVDEGAVDDLVDYRERAPNAVRAHPRDEHLLPLFVALGAGGTKPVGRRIHSGFNHGSLSMAAFSFS